MYSNRNRLDKKYLHTGSFLPPKLLILTVSPGPCLPNFQLTAYAALSAENLRASPLKAQGQGFV